MFIIELQLGRWWSVLVFPETTPTCVHKLQFEMLHVPESILRNYENDPSGARRKNKRQQQRKARIVNNYDERNPSKSRGAGFSSGSIVPLKLQDGGGILSQRNSCVDASLMQKRGNIRQQVTADHVERHTSKRRGTVLDSDGIAPVQFRDSGGFPSRRESSVSSVDSSARQHRDNIRQQVGRMLDRIGKHPSIRCSIVHGVTSDTFDQTYGLSRRLNRRQDVIAENVLAEDKVDTGQGQRKGSICSEKDVTQVGSGTSSCSALGKKSGGEDTFTRQQREQVSGHGNTTEKCHSRKCAILKLVQVRVFSCSTVRSLPHPSLTFPVIYRIVGMTGNFISPPALCIS